MSEDIVERANRLLTAKFSPEPWEVYDDGDPDVFDGYTIWHDDGQPGTMEICKNFHQGPDDGLGDAQFVAAAPTLVRGLIAEIERLRDQAGVAERTEKQECTCNADNGYACDLHPRRAMRRRQMTQDDFWDNQ